MKSKSPASPLHQKFLFVSILFATIGLTFFGVVPASSTTLIGQTINADIQIMGSDDHGSYTISVLNGPVTITGPGDFVDTIPVFKQLTFGGFSTSTNQINGNVVVDISANTISVTMNGQVQPFELENQFTGINGPIVNVVQTASGVIAGVNSVNPPTFTPTSVDFSSIYFGFQTGTSLRQTETLTFGVAAVPEPSTWAMMLLGFVGLGFAFHRSRRKVSFA